MNKKINLIILIFLGFLLMGCSSKTDFDRKDDNPDISNEDNKVIKNIDNMMKANFDYEYVATALDGNLIYNGTNYDNISKGTKFSSFNNETINYQMENYQCFDPHTKSPIFNVFLEGESDYLNLSKLKTKIQKATCEIDLNSAVCSDGYVSYSIIFNNEYISKISIDISNVSTNFTKYELNYTNINNTEIIKNLFPYVFVEFYSTNNNNSLNEINNKILGYGISNVKLVYMNKEIKINFENIKKIIEYADNTKEYINDIKKYTFKDYVIFIKFSNEDKFEKIILGKIENSNEILNIIMGD